MANEWFIQHGGKQYGPLTSAQLKKLAGERKITPSTQVRLGPSGSWVPATRVQGLFAAQTATPPPAPPPDPLAAPPVAASAPPPQARPPQTSPLMAKPLGSASRAAPPEANESALAAKLIGAVGLILGILALATFWLPILRNPLGWTGIVVGALGLLLGIAGLVVAAMQKGSGLYVNVAAASSSVVGLVLTVVLGVTFGMFSSPAPQPVATPAPAPPITVPAPVEMPPQPEPEPEPEPPPEPVWTHASQVIEQGPIRAKIESVGVQNIRLESTDLSTLRAGKPQPMLKIRVSIENTTEDKIVQVPGWIGGGSGLTGQLGGLLEGSELGQQLKSATATARAFDNAGNNYAQMPAIRVFGGGALATPEPAVRPGEAVAKEMIFDPPLESIEYLRVELPPEGFSGSDSLRFEIPRDMITGLPGS